MKKNIIKINVYLLTLLVLLTPFVTKAATDDYQYQHEYIVYSDISSDVLQDKSGLNSTGYYITASDYHSPYTVFFVHFAKKDGKYYLMYCSKMGNYADAELDDSFLVSTSSNGSIATDNHGTPFSDAEDVPLSEEKRKLLENLLSNTAEFDPTHTRYKVSGMTNAEKLKIIAMQLLVWEVIEGGRDNLNTYEPNLYHESNSAYKRIIVPNGCDTGSVKSGSLCYHYRKIIDDVKSGTAETSAPAFGKTYDLKWNSSKQAYYNSSITGLGKYVNCKSNNNDVQVSVKNSTATITSTKEVSDAKITCTYSVSSGSEGEPFIIFNYADSVDICRYTPCQGFVYGGGSKLFSKSFNVKTEKTKIKITKKDTGKNVISGAKFKMTLKDNSKYTLNIDGNADSQNIVKSGTYLVSETVAPSGYERISDFEISIDVSNQKVTSCTNSTKDSSGNITNCLNNQVTVTIKNDTIYLTVYDKAKSFNILKLDSDGKTAVKGATFQIKDSNNKVVKFRLDGKIYTYDANGTITSLSDSNASTYSVALLPNGNYSLVETAVPSPYSLPSKEAERTTKIQVKDGNLSVYDASQKKYVASSNASVQVKNYITKVKVLKTGNGKSLPGVVFSLLKEDKETYVNSTHISSSESGYRYQGNGTSEDHTLYTTNSKGLLAVYSLPEGTYYFKEEQTVEPYSLPIGDAAYTKVTIEITSTGVKVNGSLNQDTISISNSTNSFNFYKVDENGNYLKEGKFKIQKWDDTKNRYVDIRVKSVENDGSYDPNADIFEPSNDGKVKFGLTNGIATFINMAAGTKYRIVETNAPEGYAIGDAKDGAVVTLDKYGYSQGLLVLTNQKIVKETDAAQAELIITISTGMQRVKYALIIGGVIVLLSGLIFVSRKMNKKERK